MFAKLFFSKYKTSSASLYNNCCVMNSNDYFVNDRKWNIPRFFGEYNGAKLWSRYFKFAFDPIYSSEIREKIYDF